MNENTKLWNEVRTPDPKHTKAFNRGGGFKGTATNVVYLIQRATELWGPMGGKWGVEIKNERYVDGAPIIIDGNVVCRQIIHVIQIELRHPDGVVPGIGQTEFVGKNKNGLFTDEEAPKKSLTDALTKAMSWLGFAADIHMGLWDDNKYVNNVRIAFERAAEEEHPETLTTEEVAAVTKAVRDTGADVSLLLSWVSEKCGREIVGIADIPAEAYSAVLKALAKAGAKRAAEPMEAEGSEA